MGKGLRITNIIFFVLATLVQLAALYFEINLFITLGDVDSLGKGLGMAIFLHFILIASAIVLGLALIITILSIILKRKMKNADLPSPKIDVICNVLPWLYVLINIVTFVLFNILA